MEEIVYHTNYKLEDNYWWFVARNRIIRDIIDEKCNLKDGDDFLDVGCGTGGFTAMLLDRFKVIGLDASQTALEYSKKRGLKNLYDCYLDSFPKEKWNVKGISMLDVIEHIEDDLAVAKQAYDILPDGGCLVLSVPAYQWLWSRHDEIHMHYRRYTKAGIKNVLKKAGFEIEFSSYMNFFLFPAAVIKRFIDKITGADKKHDAPVDEVSAMMNKIFTKLFLFEGKLLKLFRFPVGVSVLIIARKKNPD